MNLFVWICETVGFVNHVTSGLCHSAASLDSMILVDLENIFDINSILEELQFYFIFVLKKVTNLLKMLGISQFISAPTKIAIIGNSLLDFVLANKNNATDYAHYAPKINDVWNSI